MAEFDVAVIGAGMVGVSCALWAQKSGHRVVLIDPNSPGSGTSSGNACTLATYGCIPVNSPSVLTSLPQLLLAKDSPLSLNYAYAMTHPGWMLAFLANCRAKQATRIAQHLSDMLHLADDGFNPLIDLAKADDLIRSQGQITVWSTDAAAKAAQADLALRAKLGVPFDVLTPDQARQMEPGLQLDIKHAVHFHKARQVIDPVHLISRLYQRFMDMGGQFIDDQVAQVTPQGAEVRIQAKGTTVSAGHVVVACGAFSKSIAGSGAEKLPLGSERGYHLMYRSEAHRVTRPVGWAEGGFYAVPTDHGLRLAGTVEIAALNARPNKTRLAYIARRGAEFLGALPEPDQEWLGHRPTMPDSLPVIGPSPVSDRIILAFGHQHLGLTLGGLTGQIVTSLIEKEAPPLDIAPFKADRRFVSP